MSKKELRTSRITTTLTPKEFEHISNKSKMTGLNNAVYIRNIAMNYPLKSVVDQLALSEVIKSRADLGRLGGLLKMWLVSEKDTKLELGKRTYENIKELVDEIEVKQHKLLELAEKLLSVKEL